MTIQRYGMIATPHDNLIGKSRDGDFVSYTDHLALVAAAYRDAADKVMAARLGEADNDLRSIWHNIDQATPADAQAALTAIERAAYERGVRAMADMAIGALAVPQIGTVSEIVRDMQRALLTQEGR